MWISVIGILSALAGPWVHAVGEGYTRVGYRVFTSQQGYAAGAETGMNYVAHYGTAYTEWGLPGRVQIIADLPYVSASQGTPKGVRYHHNWTGDFRFEVDWGALPNALGTVGVEVRLPTYRDPFKIGKAEDILTSEFDAIAPRFPVLGDACVDITVKWMMGKGFKRGWIWGSFGPRFRTKAFRQQVWGSLQGGAWLWPQRIALAGYMEGAYSLPIGKETHASRDWVYAQAQVMLSEPKGLPGWALELGFGGTPIARNTSKGIDFSVGISYRLKRKKGS